MLWGADLPRKGRVSDIVFPARSTDMQTQDVSSDSGILCLQTWTAKREAIT